MHQHPRPYPQAGSSASNAATNPERTNNPRDRPPARTRSSVDLTSYAERGGDGGGVGPGDQAVEQSRAETPAASKDREAALLNQIIQHFHTKAALLISSARANLPQVYARNGDIRQNRWFNVVLDETDVLDEDLQDWKRPDLVENRPSSLVLEVYLDTVHLSQNQALVAIDDSGKRYDVADSLASSADSSMRPSRNGGRVCEVVLERWTVELGDPEDYTAADLQDALPNVYKKGVVLFRSLYTVVRLLPTWKLQRKLTRQPGSHQALKPKFRIRPGQGVLRRSKDALYSPLYPSEQGTVVERQKLAPLLCPAGPLCVSVDYRTSCEFGVADAEALLSSRFLGLDEGRPTIPVGRSLPGPRSEQSRIQPSSVGAAMNVQRPRLGAYGSLGTFHASDKRGSPVTELSQRIMDYDNHEASPRSDDRIRRPSISFASNPPFKAGSLASSPRPVPSPSTSIGRYDSGASRPAAASASKRVSLNTLPQHSLRTPTDTAIASSGSASPKPPGPVHRYSSSFVNRSRRFTSQGSKTGGSNESSERASSSSKEKLILPTEGTPGSSGSGRTDEDDIASFISQVESAKDLPSFRTRPTSRDNTVNLAKYSSLRDPNAQLADEMSSSSLIQASVTPPSRRLSNVPGLSTSSSPSRALAYAPHVRSRLSTHSIAEEITHASRQSAEGPESPKIHEEQEDDEDEEPFIFPLPHDSV